MTALVGNTGVISINSQNVAEVRSYSIEMTADTIETTAMGDGSARRYVKGLNTFSGTADVYWIASHFSTADLDGLIQGAVGSSAVALKVYPTGTGANWGGNIIVTGYSVSASFDGLVEASISFQGDGALTYTAS
jgi:predicted secreted protein